MMRRLPPLLLATALSALSLGACGSDTAAELEPPASKVEIPGTDRYQVVLTPEAVERIDLQTVEVTETEGRSSITSDALILDTDGEFWVYVNLEPYTYERALLEEVREVDGQALFTGGPEPGTPVVFVGVAELYGEETGVGK
jgi:hypothetical protein